MTKGTISIKVDPPLVDELEKIAQTVGFKDADALIQNYIREVVISARVEQAVSQLRDTVVRGSTDLDDLKVERLQPGTN
ncbi:MAG: hypothetical protein ABIQ89_04430 [Candidatus Saccharimonadales bacterium]